MGYEFLLGNFSIRAQDNNPEQSFAQFLIGDTNDGSFAYLWMAVQGCLDL